MIREAWSGVDVQLKRRSDLVPNLVQTVKAYGAHESQIFERVIELRSQGVKSEGLSEKADRENEITGFVKQFFALAEAYPEIKADSNFLELQKQLTEIENQLQYARRYYNGTVREYNIGIQSFPGNLVSQLFRFAPEDYFEVTLATEREAPEVNL